MDDGPQPQVIQKGFEPQEIQISSPRLYICGISSGFDSAGGGAVHASKRSTSELHPRSKVHAGISHLCLGSVSAPVCKYILCQSHLHDPKSSGKSPVTSLLSHRLNEDK